MRLWPSFAEFFDVFLVFQPSAREGKRMKEKNRIVKSETAVSIDWPVHTLSCNLYRSRARSGYRMSSHSLQSLDDAQATREKTWMTYLNNNNKTTVVSSNYLCFFETQTNRKCECFYQMFAVQLAGPRMYRLCYLKRYKTHPKWANYQIYALNEICVTIFLSNAKYTELFVFLWFINPLKKIFIDCKNFSR